MRRARSAPRLASMWGTCASRAVRTRRDGGAPAGGGGWRGPRRAPLCPRRPRLTAARPLARHAVRRGKAYEIRSDFFRRHEWKPVSQDHGASGFYLQKCAAAPSRQSLPPCACPLCSHPAMLPLRWRLPALFACGLLATNDFAWSHSRAFCLRRSAPVSTILTVTVRHAVPRRLLQSAPHLAVCSHPMEPYITRLAATCNS